MAAAIKTEETNALYIWFVNLQATSYELHVSIFCAYCIHLYNDLFLTIAQYGELSILRMANTKMDVE